MECITILNAPPAAARLQEQEQIMKYFYLLINIVKMKFMRNN